MSRSGNHGASAASRLALSSRGCCSFHPLLRQTAASLLFRRRHHQNIGGVDNGISILGTAKVVVEIIRIKRKEKRVAARALTSPRSNGYFAPALKRFPSFRSTLSRSAVFTLALLACASCERSDDKITVYRIPKETATPAMMPQRDAMGAAAAVLRSVKAPQDL